MPTVVMLYAYNHWELKNRMSTELKEMAAKGYRFLNSAVTTDTRGYIAFLFFEEE